MERIRNRSKSALTAAGFVESEAARAAKQRWAKSTGSVKIFERLLKNWLSKTPVSVEQFLINNREYIEELQSLPSNSYKDVNGNYNITPHGIVLAAAMGVPGARRIADQCNRAYKILRRRYVASPEEEQSNQGLTSGAIAEQLKLPLRDAARVLGILEEMNVVQIIMYGLNPASAERPMTISPVDVSSYQLLPTRQILFHADIWSLFEIMVEHYSITALPFATIGSARVPAFAYTIEHHILAICPKAKDFADKAMERLMPDPAGAVTAARSMVEAAVKWVATEHGIFEEVNGARASKGLKACFKAIGGVEKDFEKPGISHVIMGMDTALNGLDEARNAMGDGHGPAPNSPVANTRIAALLVGYAITTITFLLQSHEARKRP